MSDILCIYYSRTGNTRRAVEEIAGALAALDDAERCGIVLRAKGIVAGENGEWIHFDYVPGESSVRTGSAGIIGRICVIGSKMNEEVLSGLFHLA